MEVETLEIFLRLLHFSYDRLYVEEWFFEKDGEVFVCEITFAIMFGKEGELLFLWRRDQKES